VRGSAPFGLLHDLSHRGKVARERLLLVAGEGAALILAFAVFLATARRRETELLDDQLAVFGASRQQFWIARGVEVVAPCAAGVCAALAALLIASLAVPGARSTETVLAIVAVALVGVVLLLLAQAPSTGRRFGIELAALSALGVVVWESATSDALDPDRVASSSGTPVLLLVPALAFFAVGVLVLRVVPYALRAGARATRNAAPALRLAFLTAARNPQQVAAATTFLAVALGASLFSLDYRATLDRQADDHANFVAGAEWRISGRHVRTARWKTRREPSLRPSSPSRPATSAACAVGGTASRRCRGQRSRAASARRLRA
jgi:hypothetical protein